ncbi:MAG: hypothetical protein ABIP51_11360 [Bacteroidia bacterium]
MIKVKTEETRKEIVDFLTELKEKQLDISETNEIYYPKLSLYLALKKKIFFKNLLLHPLVLINVPFYYKKNKIKESELEFLLLELIEFELTEKVVFLSIQERDKIIKIHKSLKTKREKNGTVIPV